MESTLLEEALGRRDGHDFEDIQLASAFDTLSNEIASQPGSAKFLIDRQTPNLGEFPRIDFQRGESNDVTARLRDKAVPDQFAKFVARAWEQFLRSDERFDELVKRVKILLGSAADVSNRLV